MNQIQELNKFCEAFEGKASQSDQRFYKRERVSNWSELNNPLVDYKFETVEALAIHIPLHRVDDFLSILDEQKYLEMEIRASVPAVKIAYERYRLLLRMCKGDHGA